MIDRDKFDLCADKSTLDLEALINVASNSIYDATHVVEMHQSELRSRELDILVRKDTECLSYMLIQQESSARLLAKAANRLASAWKAYHYLVATRDREVRIVE